MKAKAFHRARIFGIETTRNVVQPQDVALFALARHKILAQNPALRADSARIVQPFLEGKASPRKSNAGH